MTPLSATVVVGAQLRGGGWLHVELNLLFKPLFFGFFPP